MLAHGGNGFGLFEPFSVSSRLPLIVTGCARSAPQVLHPLWFDSGFLHRRCDAVRLRYDQIKNWGDVSVVALGRYRLKKVGRPFELYAAVSDVVLEPSAFA